MTKPNKYSFTNKDDIRYQTIIDLLSLATGLDLAISSLKNSEVSQQASDEIRKLIMQSYITLANKQAISILNEYNAVVGKEYNTNQIVSIDTPDNDHEDIIVEYNN